jgi:hypothetical protein
LSTNVSYCDGLTKDNFGNYYVTSWSTLAIYRIDSAFSSPPVQIYYHYGGPADIAYNRRDDILAIPLMSINSYDLVPISPTSIPGEENNHLPRKFDLGQNFPNPFNPRTTITFNLSSPVSLKLQIFDIKGRLIKTLAGGEMWEAGPHSVSWDGRNDEGNEVGSGIFFYRIESGDFSETRKMVLLR